MAYNNPGAGAALSGDNPTPAPDSEMEHEGGGEMLHIPSSMLPEGMAQDIKEGDILEFKCVGTADENGGIPVEYNTGKAEEKDDWAEGMRKHMSPRTGDGEMEQEAM